MSDALFVIGINWQRLDGAGRCGRVWGNAADPGER